MSRSKQNGNALTIAVIAIVVIAMLGALGFVFWNNFLKKDSAIPESNTSEVQKVCLDDETETAANGVFCSENIGIKFTVPTIFMNKLTKIDNYEVFQGAIDFATKVSAGSSEAVLSAEIRGNDNYTLIIAKEPLRSGYVDVGHMLKVAYFDKETGNLNLINTPTNQYNSDTDTFTQSGSYSVGDEIPSFIADGVRLFKGTIGDAGTQIVTYFGVIKDKIVRIQLTNNGYIGDPADDPTTIDASAVFEELGGALKNLKVI